MIPILKLKDFFGLNINVTIKWEFRVNILWIRYVILKRKRYYIPQYNTGRNYLFLLWNYWEKLMSTLSPARKHRSNDLYIDLY